MLLTILILINLKVVYDIIRVKISVFNPVGIFALTVITQMFPQLVVLYTNNIYNKEFIPNLLLVMILCQLAFQIGYKYGFRYKSNPSKITVVDFSLEKIIPLIVFFVILGFIPMFFYKSITTVYGGINVVLGHFRVIGVYGYIIAFIYIEKYPNKNKWILRLILAIAAIPILYFAFLVKGSREIAFTFVLIALIFVSRIKERLHKPISLFFLVLFIGGAFLGESISDLRKHKQEFNVDNLLQIDYVNNFKVAMFEREIINGMDLGNSTLLMSYVTKHTAYDLGTSVWNDFVFNFVPGRFIGESTKQAFYIDLFDNLKTRDYENSLRNDITTITGYGSTFRSFSYFGFIFFYLFGAMLSRFKKYSMFSSYYLFIYVSCLTVIPNMITHTTQYMFARLELIFIFMFPIFLLYLRKKNVSLV
jgi:hypothetical protein